MNRSMWAVVALVCACKPAERGGKGTAGTPIKAASVGGFQTPESVKWDSAQDVYFVSNINGAPGVKDGNGYITRLGPAGMVMDIAFMKGLDAPKGLALVHDTLWVADIDQVRAFDARTAAPVATVPVGRHFPQRHCRRSRRLALRDRHRDSLRRERCDRASGHGSDLSHRAGPQGERRAQDRHAEPAQRHHLGPSESALHRRAVRWQVLARVEAR